MSKQTYFYLHALFMKNAILILILLCCIFSCSRDEVIPCDRYGGIEGDLCREYRYVNGSSVGYREFEYKGDSILVTAFYNENNALQQSTVKRFENGRINAIATQYPNRPSLVQSWHYNEIDSVSLIVFGTNDSVVKMEYERGLRVRESFSTDSLLNRYTRYQYFEDDGVLFKVSHYNGQDSLLRYRTLENFSNGKKRVNYFGGDNQNLGYTISEFSVGGLITLTKRRDTDGNVTGTVNYIYDANGNLTERSETLTTGTLKSVFLYY